MLQDEHVPGPGRGRIWNLVYGLLILAIIAAASYQIVVQSSAERNRGLALQELSKLLAPGVKDLGALVLANYREYRANAVRWSFAYFGCLFGSALASASAGVVLKLEALKSRPSLKNDSAAALAALAALLITLSTSGDFQRKWQANRTAADAMENLSYDLMKTGTALDRDSILDRIQAINDARSEGVVGKARRDEDAGRNVEGAAKPAVEPPAAPAKEKAPAPPDKGKPPGPRKNP